MPVPLLVDPFLGDERLKDAGYGGELEQLLRSDPEEAVSAERIVEQPERPVLQLAAEVDQDIPAGDQMHFPKTLSVARL